MKIATLDIETLGLNRVTSIVTDIGIIIADTSAEDGTETRIGIRPNITEQLLLGQKCDLGTVKFHEKYFPGGASEFLSHLQSSPTYVDMSIAQTHAVLKDALEQVEEIWINGLSFDPVVLSSLFDLIGKKTPYYYRKEVDVRSIHMRVLPRLRAILNVAAPPSQPAQHDALKDAEWNLSICKEYNSLMDKLGIAAAAIPDGHLVVPMNVLNPVKHTMKPTSL